MLYDHSSIYEKSGKLLWASLSTAETSGAGKQGKVTSNLNEQIFVRFTWNTLRSQLICTGHVQTSSTSSFVFLQSVDYFKALLSRHPD